MTFCKNNSLALSCIKQSIEALNQSRAYCSIDEFYNYQAILRGMIRIRDDLEDSILFSSSNDDDEDDGGACA